MKRIPIVVGTRPNFIKVTRFREVSAKFGWIDLKIAHTGQHSDQNMANIFFEQFGLQPDYHLNIDGQTPIAQMAQIMERLEQLVINQFPADLIITPGDVNSTLAVALVANKLNIMLAHLEAGLRSGDRTMPEEINRLLTDEISGHYFVTEKSGIGNLRHEEKTGNIHFVGNTMIDTMVAFESEIEKSSILDQLGVKNNFILMTMHRPATVDSIEGLDKLLRLLKVITERDQVVFPVHPRTRKKIREFNLAHHFKELQNVILTDAMGYFQFQKLIKSCRLVITDSGGIQEETTFRKIPCLTLRSSTERPVTVDIGTNTLIPFDIELITKIMRDIEAGSYKKGEVPELWDGCATERVMDVCSTILKE